MPESTSSMIRCSRCKAAFPRWNKSGRLVRDTKGCPSCGPGCCERAGAQGEEREIFWLASPAQFEGDVPIAELPRWGIRLGNGLHSRVDACPHCHEPLPLP